MTATAAMLARQYAVGYLLFYRLNPIGFDRPAAMDFSYSFLVGFGAHDSDDLTDNQDALREHLAVLSDVTPMRITDFFKDPHECSFDARRWSRICYLRAMLKRDISFLDVLQHASSKSERMIKSIALMQMLQTFQCARYVLRLRREMGPGNFSRAAFSGNLSEPSFQEFYFHHHVFHNAREIMDPMNYDLKARLKQVFNLWQASDLNSIDRANETADHLQRVVDKLDELTANPEFRADMMRITLVLARPYGGIRQWCNVLTGSVWPAESWITDLLQGPDEEAETD